MSSKFHFNISSPWDIAYSQGHGAIRLLRIIKDIQNEYDALQESIRKTDDVFSISLQEVARCTILTKEMLSIASSCVAAFQSMMEGIINHSLHSFPQLENTKIEIINEHKEFEKVPFSKKWNRSLKNLNISNKDFKLYNTDIYEGLRIPLIHPSINNLNEVEKVTFTYLYEGFSYGWKSYEALYQALGMPHLPDSWKVLCESHGLQIT